MPHYLVISILGERSVYDGKLFIREIWATRPRRNGFRDTRKDPQRYFRNPNIIYMIYRRVKTASAWLGVVEVSKLGPRNSTAILDPWQL
jgi:hypothetical protein